MTSFWAILALLAGLGPAFIAHGKGRSFLFWWIYSVASGPIAMIHAMLLCERRPLEFEAASRGSGASSGSNWPCLLRVLCLLALFVITVGGVRNLLPPNMNAVSQRDLASPARVQPHVMATALETIGTAAQQVATDRAPDKETAPLPSAPPVPAAKPLYHNSPPESPSSSKPTLSTVRERRKPAAQHASNELTKPVAEIQKERYANTHKVILSVQRALKQRGYDSGPADGLAGPQTEQAIREFQIDRDLMPSGEIDYLLLQALDIVKERK